MAELTRETKKKLIKELKNASRLHARQARQLERSLKTTKKK